LIAPISLVSDLLLGTVTLVGYTYQAMLEAHAETAVKRASGVDEVANKIEVLPTSQNDDRIPAGLLAGARHVEHFFRDSFPERLLRAVGPPQIAIEALRLFVSGEVWLNGISFSPGKAPTA